MVGYYAGRVYREEVKGPTSSKLLMCDMIKEAIKRESDIDYFYAKIISDTPIVYIGHETDLHRIRADVPRHKKILKNVAEEIGCPE